MRSNERYTIAAGAGLGLAWAPDCVWTAVIADDASQFTLAGTFGGVLLPAVLVGGSLGWAEAADAGSVAWATLGDAFATALHCHAGACAGGLCGRPADPG